MSLAQISPIGTSAEVHLPSERGHKLPMLVGLSDRINSLSDEYTIMRVAVEGLLGVLRARAGLMMISGAAMYTKHREPSEPLVRLENKLYENETATLALFNPRQPRPNEFTRDLVLVPVLWRDQLKGLLAFDVQRRRLVTGERSMLRLIANQLGAIFSATASPPVPDAAQYQGALRAAASVQQSLLPRIPASQACGLSIAAFTMPAEFIGGDYYDLICVEKQKLGIVIADIQGKGVAAALFGNLLRTTTHFLTRESPSPAVLLGKINTILHREATSTQKLFTMFYAMYDAATMTLTYSGSGHVSPVLIPHDGSTPHRLRSDGTPLGLSAVQRFREHSTQLACGDLVVFFTDGMIEHPSVEGESFGEERLLRCLLHVRDEHPEIIVQTVKEKLNAFAPLPSRDDMTLIVAKVPCE